MEERIKEVISSVLGADKGEISDTSSNENLPNWDSLNHMNLIVALEEEFGIEFDGGEIPELTSFSSIKQSIERHA